MQCCPNFVSDDVQVALGEIYFRGNITNQVRKARKEIMYPWSDTD